VPQHDVGVGDVNEYAALWNALEAGEKEILRRRRRRNRARDFNLRFTGHFHLGRNIQIRQVVLRYGDNFLRITVVGDDKRGGIRLSVEQLTPFPIAAE
jgi:hypothetical protein